MGKVFRLFCGELKKIFLGSGIFFMTAFLLLTLTISPKLFNPTEKEDLNSSISIETSTVLSAYSSFLTYEAELNLNNTNIENSIEELIVNKSNFKENLQNLANDIYEYRMLFNKLVLTGSENDLSICLQEFILKTNEFNQLYNTYTQSYAFPVVLVSEDLDLDIKYETSQLSKLLSVDGDKSSKEYYVSINNNLENYKPAYNLANKLVSQIKQLNYSSEDLSNLLLDYSDIRNEYTNSLKQDIVKSANSATLDEEYNITSSNIKNIKENSINYLSSLNSKYQILQNGLLLELSENISDSELSSYIGFEEFNRYKYKEQFTKYNYLLENNLSDTSLANVFSFNNSSSNNINAFDYMYFTMEIASILIIAFTVIIGAGMISKEYSDGTIKLLAIRPFNRNKIILAKVLATMFLAFILVLTTSLVSLITGYFLYGISFPTVLIVLNASSAITMPIWLVYLIYLICLLIKIWIFALLAITISTLFKSYIAAVCISTGIYILNLVLTFVSKGANWLKYNIFANLDLFKYLGGSNIVSYSANENLTNLFLSPVFPDTTILVSIISIVALAVILNIILFSVFKHRDIT